MDTPVEVRAISTIVLDIEGTLCPIWFVKKVLYPYATEHVYKLVAESWDSDDFQAYKAAFPEQAQASPEALVAHFRNLVARDVKDSALKKLQGLIWRKGYAAGELTVPIYKDVAPTLEAWHRNGLTLAIFSSGSVEAQQLFFKYVDADADLDEDDGTGNHVSEHKHDLPKNVMDLNPLFTANFDTVNAGSKVVPSSYTAIVAKLGKKADACLFLSDNVNEIYAAQEAGLKAVVVDRPGNEQLTNEDVKATTQITSLESIKLL